MNQKILSQLISVVVVFSFLIYSIIKYIRDPLHSEGLCFVLKKIKKSNTKYF